MDALLHRLQQVRWSKLNHIAPFLLVICIIYLCWKLASIFWLIVAPPQAIQITPVSLGSQQIAIPNITSFALFAEMNNSADQNLNMILQGVVVGSTNQLSSAVIKINEKSENYRVGENIEGTSLQLAEVYWNRIILLSGNGSRRELKFVGIENGLNQPLIPENTNNISSQNKINNTIDNAIQNLQENKEEYLEDIGLETSNKSGYEITDNVSNTLKNKLRLQTGDKVLSLNGQSLGSGKTEVELLELAKRAGQVKLEVQRGDQVITIQQNLK